jgi:hypothetical protein
LELLSKKLTETPFKKSKKKDEKKQLSISFIFIEKEKCSASLQTNAPKSTKNDFNLVLQLFFIYF